MWSRIIIYIMGIMTGHCNGVKVYTNTCGTVSVAEPAIDGKRVLLTFIPKDQTNVSEGGVKWKYHYGKHEYEVTNSTRYNMMAYNSSFTLDLGCIKDQDGRREYSAVYTNSDWGCRSPWFKLALLDAPTNCGLLYRQPKMIQHADEVVLEYYAPDSILKHGHYVRNLRRNNSKDCDETLGCAVDVTRFEEEYSDYNSVYAYRIRNFTDEMNGNYTLQCTNRTHDNKITNYVRLVILVAPQIPSFLNTKDIDGHENCIAVKENKNFTVRCDVEGGTFPMYVKMSIVDVVEIKECTINTENVTCEWRLRLSKDFHLVGIQCEVSNEATIRPIGTTAKLYVVKYGINPFPVCADTEFFDIEVQTIELAIKSTRNAINEEQNKEQIILPWIIAGIATTLLMVVLAVIIAVVIVTKRRKRRQNENATENVSMDVLSQYSNLCRENIGSDIGTYDSLQATENVSMDVLGQYSNLCRENIGSDIGTYDSLQDVTYANTANETKPTNTDCPRTDDGAEHAVVIPKSQRQTHGLRNVDTSSTVKQDNHNLVCADLDLNTDGTTTNNSNRVGEQLSDIGSENMYANQ